MFNESVFDPQAQNEEAGLKIVAALERLGAGFRVLLWEKAKVLDISPIQIQILIFIHYHAEETCKVSYLAREFQLSKPTISEAVRTLEHKGLLSRKPELADTRSHTLHLTAMGREMVAKTADFAAPLHRSLAIFSEAEKGILLDQLLKLAWQLQESGVITMQRMCFSCRLYENNSNQHFCHLLNKFLENSELRVDCGEFIALL